MKRLLDHWNITVVIILFITLFFLPACGISVEEAEEESTEAPQDEIIYVEVEPEAPEEDEFNLDPEPVFLKGSISSGFHMTVDGTTYADSEDFYSQKIDVLEAEKIESGYEDYEMTFDAELGLTDLKNGMTVFAETAGDSGWSAETIVVSNGTFGLEFPDAVAGNKFQVRANKRIGVILVNGTEKIYWCYNFSATQETKLTRESLPVLMRHFTTRLTKYKCQGGRSNSLSIPKSTSDVVPDGANPTQAQLDKWDEEWDEYHSEYH